MLEPADHALLVDVGAALAVPFADPVTVAGQPMARRVARQVERALLRLKKEAGPRIRSGVTAGGAC